MLNDSSKKLAQVQNFEIRSENHEVIGIYAGSLLK